MLPMRYLPRHKTTILHTYTLHSLRRFYSASENSASKVARSELLSRKLPILYDNLHLQRSILLRKTIDSFLPNFQSNPTFRSQENHLLHPGHHLIFFPQPTETSALLPDGTDTVHSPGDPWTNRLWAGGRVRFPRVLDLVLDGQMKVLVESIRDVRVTGSGKSEKIFVKIERRIGHFVNGQTEQQTVSEMIRAKEDDLTNALLVETRDLCFMRPPSPGSPTVSSRRVTVPSTLPDYSHSLFPTPALLFRFSALTFNAHAIHIDPEYTRKEYGLPKLLVHGPLSLTLMLEYMRRVLEMEAMKRDLQFEGMNPENPALVVTEINYRNLAPLFVSEEMTISCARRQDVNRNSDGSDTTAVSESWDIWIQTGRDEQASLSVRGVITVESKQRTT